MLPSVTKKGNENIITPDKARTDSCCFVVVITTKKMKRNLDDTHFMIIYYT
jgi:hypothetical protein